MPPAASWRPYADTSPFNTPVKGKASIDSGKVVKQLTDGGPPAYIVPGDPLRPDNIACYWAQLSDPVYTLHADWDSPVEGHSIHVPNGAMPQGNVGSDAHLTIVQPDGWEYDLWAVKQPTLNGGGSLTFIQGGRTRIDGDGLDSYAVASRFGSLAGLIRPEELVAGKINHALQMFVPYATGHKWPADHDGLDRHDPFDPPMGAHFRWGQTAPEIKAEGYPKWKQAILLALRKYGAYVADTTANPAYWGFRIMGTASYVAGEPTVLNTDKYQAADLDPLVTLAHSLGIAPDDYNHNGWPEYWFDLGSGTDWTHLRLH